MGREEVLPLRSLLSQLSILYYTLQRPPPTKQLLHLRSAFKTSSFHARDKNSIFSTLPICCPLEKGNTDFYCQIWKVDEELYQLSRPISRCFEIELRPKSLVMLSLPISGRASLK